MNKRKPLMKFFLMTLACGLGGGLLSAGMMMGQEVLARLAQDLQWWLAYYYTPLQLGVTLLCGGSALVDYRRARRLSSPEAEDRDFQRGEVLLSRSMGALSVLVILSFTLFGCYGAGLFWLQEVRGPLSLLLPVLVFLASMGLMVYGQVRQVKLTQLRNPEKRGNPLEMNFQKDWLASCDEAEQYIIYQASHRSYQATGKALMVAWVAAVVSGMIFNTGLLPVLMVGGILAVHTLSYLAAVSRPQRQEKKQPGPPPEE